jgi:hypothetical protein
MAIPQLPIELLEMIIENLSPPGAGLALPASDITTRTLYSCLTVSKPTFNRSLELLYSKCLYINNQQQLHALLRSYQSESFALDLKISASTSMFLAPFTGDTIDEPKVVEDLHNLFDILGNSIRRMVIDMPLRSAYPDRREGREIRVPLRNAFRKLMALEEFTSVRDELYLSTIMPKVNDIEPPVWSRWPNLQRIALYNVDISEDLLKNVTRLRSIKTLVLTRPDGMEDLGPLREALTPATTIVIVNTWESHLPAQRRWIGKAIEAGQRQRITHSDIQYSYTRDIAHVKAVCVSEISLNGGHDAQHIYQCQDWIKAEALSDALWH